MEFLKNGTTLCPYCKQPLDEGEHNLYCRSEGCGKTFEKYDFIESDDWKCIETI